MGKQKKLCWKCGGRHQPPTGKKCEETELSNNVGGSSVSEEVTGSDIEMDSHDIPSTSKMPLTGSKQGPQEEIQRQILHQLEKVNRRLDKVENRMTRDQQEDKGHHKGHHKTSTKLSKISKKHFAVLSDSSHSSSESSDEEQCIP